jgi:hypothetical protein
VKTVKIWFLALGVAAVTLIFAAATATADTVSQQGVLHGVRYHGGLPSAGEIGYLAAVEVARDPAGEVVSVRGRGTIAKHSKVLRVAVDRVTLGTSTVAVVSTSGSVNSGAASSATSSTIWRHVAPRTCTRYRVRVYFSIRWSDGTVGSFSVLSPLTTVCGPTNPRAYANCAALNADFPHGVGRVGAVDHTAGTRVTTFYVSNYVYSANTGRDGDHDGIACERA